jgi:glycosyltransferase involved in cell wall biosynthesis
MAPGLEPIVAPMPVSADLFNPDERAPRERLLFVGRLNEQKGLATLLEAMAQSPHATGLDVVGAGPDERALRVQADMLGVADRVRWLGHLAQPELVPLYQRARALIVPSVEEGLGLVAVEAQLCETPVIASASGGLPDIVRDGETGLLVPPTDSVALARAMDVLTSNPERARSMGRAGRRDALDTFSPAAAARRYIDIYERAIRNPA